jgi:hypothetical protein
MHNLINRNLSQMTADELVQSLQSDSENGLSILEALNRLHSHGPNKFEVEEKVCLKSLPFLLILKLFLLGTYLLEIFGEV